MRSVLVLLVLLLAVPAALGAAAGGDNQVDLSNMLSKLPVILPLIKTKVKPACADKLEVFVNEFQNNDAQQQDKTVREAVCAVGLDCTQQVVTLLAGFVKGGGLIGKLVGGMLGEGVDVENIDMLMLAYYQNMCSSKTKSTNKRASEEEL
jgi:hypothetical protein